MLIPRVALYPSRSLDIAQKISVDQGRANLGQASGQIYERFGQLNQFLAAMRLVGSVWRGSSVMVAGRYQSSRSCPSSFWFFEPCLRSHLSGGQEEANCQGPQSFCCLDVVGDPDLAKVRKACCP